MTALCRSGVEAVSTLPPDRWRLPRLGVGTSEAYTGEMLTTGHQEETLPTGNRTGRTEIHGYSMKMYPRPVTV